MKIIIIGGNGAMGKLFAKLWHSLGHNVVALDKSDWSNAKNILNNADLVVISVPIAHTISVIEKVSPLLSPDTILADFTSIKILPYESMLKNHLGPVLALHPMFGPNITSANRQVIINCGGREDNTTKWVIESFSHLGFKLVAMEPQQHDNIMGFVQGIEHFNTFILGSFLKKYNLQPKEIFNISSPIYQAKLALMGRIFDQDAALYADIIMADDNRVNLLRDYANYLNTWIKKISAGAKEDFIDIFNETSKWMGEFTTESQLASDKFLAEVNQVYVSDK